MIIMRITSITLINYKRILNGLNKEILRIEFPNSRIIRIQGTNGSGKSTLLKFLTPLPDSNDEIITGKEGSKNIVIEDKVNMEVYEITYVYKPSVISGRQKPSLSKRRASSCNTSYAGFRE